MTRADLIAEVELAVETTPGESELTIETIFAAMVRALKGGDEVEIRGFGSFRIRQRSARTGRNPKTSAPISVPAKRVAYFKPSKELKELVNDSATPSATPEGERD
jgi:integration host factor subunit beta